MAKVSTKPKIDTRTVSQFWPRYRRRALVVVLGSQTVLVLGVMLLLELTGNSIFSGIKATLMTCLVIALALGLCALSFFIVTRPLRTLAAAIRYAADEPSNEKPPTANLRHDPDGITPLLNTIYNIKPAKSSTQATASADAPDFLLDALNTSDTGIVLMSKDGTLLYANAAAPTITTGDGVTHLHLLTDSIEAISAWAKTQQDTSIKSTTSWQRVPSDLPDNTERRFFDIYAQYTNEARVPLILTFVNRSKDYEPAERELNFISFAAHELRGPITVIRGYADTLHKELANVLASDQNMLFERLIVSSNRLSSYVNNILNAAQYDRRHLKIYLHEDTLANVYASIADDMALRANTQNRLLSVTIPDTLPTIAADRASLGEVIGNLIDNAIKYSSEGGTIQVDAVSLGSSVQLTVTDHGIGMPSNVVEQLFTKFYRSHRSRETVSGTGIGLYISKAIVESHGGTIEVRSVEGEGSTFSVTLPVYASIAEKLRANQQSNESLIERNTGWIKNHGKIRG